MLCLDRKYLWPALVVAALLAWYTYAYHQPHLALAFPFLFLLACPLMHLFMMRGHSEKKGEKDEKKNEHNKHDGGHSCCH